MTYRAILFDLDGTLIDSLQDIAAAANAVLRQSGFAAHPVEQYRQFVGEGVARLFQRALPEHAGDEAAAQCAAAFADQYALLWKATTRPYVGIPELLDELAVRRFKLAVLSNKPHPFTTACVAQLLSRWEFASVRGAREGVPRKPDPTAALQIAEELQILPAEFFYLGDSGVDMQTAIAAGMFSVGAAWGFRSREELRDAGAAAVIERPLDLAKLVDRGTDGG